DSSAAAGLAPAPGDRVVIKVVSPEILHKTEAGGVAMVANEPEAIRAAVADMEARFKGLRVEGYTVNEFVSFEPRLGHEIIVGYRFARDFGPVVSFGPGGIYTEFLAKNFMPGAASLFLSPDGADRGLVREALRGNAVRELLCGGLRGTKPTIEEDRLVDLLMAFVEAAPAFARAGITELEVNPFVVQKGAAGGPAELVALDALAKLGTVASGSGELAVAADGSVVNRAQAERPVGKIDRLLSPASAAVIGVSEKGMNNGRIILRNLLENGFDPARLYVVKAGLEEIDGCRCVPDVASLPEKVDLFVLVIPASQAPACIAELAETDKAESVIVIPGGLEEKSGTEAIVARMRAALDASRSGPSRGPLLNGGNCLGVRSVPGKYNTLFIPEYKLPMPTGRVAPVALVSQSGAFAICRVSKHPDLNPKYVITCGNQMDVTVGDYLERLALDTEIRLFAVYVEGFKPMDGLKTLRAVRRIVESGRRVIFYRAGRTAAGAAASASHTASIAGDYPVTRALLSRAGAAVVESLDDFDDALTLFSAFSDGKKAGGARLGALSNAGFECVAFADNLGRLSIAEFGKSTTARLERTLADAKIGEIVDAHNPLDVTPMGDDALYYDTFDAILADDSVDVGIVGIVPLTARMNTLAAGKGHAEDVTRGDSLAARYGELFARTQKPWVAVVDSGELYDPLARELVRRGVPTFRTADRALRMLNLWLKATASQYARS
ncbi:MAG: acetate--CoA ligase family protein, partial [Spirochaetes bacterium]|nr:acetate--CoA ligase family protein [Spirochaetota bacterium]